MMVVADRTGRSTRAGAGVHDAAVDAKETHHLMGPELVSRLVGLFPPAPAERLFHARGEGRPEQSAEHSDLECARPAMSPDASAGRS